MLDLLIKGGRVIDGAGNPWYEADVGVQGDRIVAVGRSDASAARTIDAHGLFVCPGFTDMHTHSDIQLLADPAYEVKVRQGVTCDVIGQDGLSVAPVTDDVLAQLRVQLAGWNDDPPGIDWGWRSVSEYLDRFHDVAINSAFLVPHATVRMVAMGTDDRPPADSELAEMKRLVREGIEQGAVGLSSGLTYAPGMYASDDELVELCSAMREHKRLLLPAPPQLRLGRARRLPATASRSRAGPACRSTYAHAHLGFPVNRGKAPELLAMIDDARAEGVDVTMDTYPYLAGSTYLHAYLPGWSLAGGPEATIARLRDPGLRERLRVEMEETGSDGAHGVPIDWSAHVVSGARRPEHGRWIGKSVADGAAEAGKRPIDFYCELIADEELGASVISHIGNEENVRLIMQHPAHMAGSDGILVGERPHPRGWGTFPRYLAVYVRELGILTWSMRSGR